MSKLELKFLGLFSVTHDGAPVTSFESNKVRALLAYLAVEAQRPHARETLAALLSPDWPDSAARSNLRYALADLRKVIRDQQADPPFLLISRDAIQFNLASDHRVDVVEFARLATPSAVGASSEGEIERLCRALELYRGAEEGQYPVTQELGNGTAHSGGRPRRQCGAPQLGSPSMHWEHYST